MFGHDSSTGSIGTLTVLAAVALGALITPLDCAVARAQQPDLNLRLASADILLFQDAEADEIAPGTALTGRKHPSWVTDVESKAWPGLLTGLPGYEDFVMPVGMPMYFEDPFITTDIRLLYMHHEIPSDSVLGNGQVHVAAAQIRLALAERLALIVTKGGYSWVDSHETPAGDGWNDWGFGLKYALYSNPEDQFLVSTGLRWELTNGSTDAWQGGESQELSPFMSMAKGWDRWHFLGALSGRIPTDRGAGNASIVWNLHLDYELTEKFRPLIELHGIHYLSDGDAFPYNADYLDAGSMGATDVRGRDFFSAGLGFRWQVAPNTSVGLTYELPLESSSENLQEHRVTFNTVVSF